MHSLTIFLAWLVSMMLGAWSEDTTAAQLEKGMKQQNLSTVLINEVVASMKLPTRYQ
jgi:hypothetical protein